MQSGTYNGTVTTADRPAPDKTISVTMQITQPIAQAATDKCGETRWSLALSTAVAVNNLGAGNADGRARWRVAVRG